MNIIEEYKEPSTGDRFAQAFGNLGKTAGEKLPGLMQDQQNIRREEAELKDIHAQLGLGKSNIRDKKILTMMMENQVKKENDDPFKKSIQGAAGKKYGELQENFMRAKSTMGELDHLDGLVESLSGVSNTLRGMGMGEKAADASELAAAGTTIIDSILKTFNPTGALPMGKLKLILEGHAPSPYQFAEKSTGKINALRRFNEVAMHRNMAYQEMLAKYKGFIPPEVIAGFDAKSDNLIDDLEKELRGGSSSTQNKEVDDFDQYMQ